MTPVRESCRLELEPENTGQICALTDEWIHRLGQNTPGVIPGFC